MKKMKKILNKISLMLFASTMVLVSCDEQLDVTTYNNITGASFWQNPEDATTYLYGIAADYKGLTNGNIGSFNVSEGRTDMLKPGTGGPTLTGRSARHTQTALLGTGSWTGWYNTIHHTNLLLLNTPELNFDSEDEKNEILAKGYTYRAMIYFDLVRIFGDVPIVTDPTLGRVAPENLIGRSSKTDVLNLIKSDLDMAISLYPSDGVMDKNFVSKASAYALKAEVYMWSGKALTARGASVAADLNTAIQAIDAALASVSFEPTYSNIFNRSANSAGEYIMATYHSKDEGSNVFSRVTIRPGFIPDPALINTFPHAQVSEGHSNISYGDYIDTLYDPSDLRYVYNVFNIPGSSDQVVTKFGGYIESAENRRYWDNDIPLFRYSDLLLLKAEAQNTLGQTGAAVTIMNLTRNRAGIGDYTGPMDQDSVEDEIIEERARELAFENKHWWDLCRAHKAGQYITRFMTERGDDSTSENVWNFYYWPISESMMLKNDQLEQSAGYN